MKKILVLTLALGSLNSFSALDLNKKLDSLNIPDDKVSPMISQDKLHIVNTRYSSLVNRYEITMAGANDFMSDSHMETKQFFATARYHIDSKWGIGVRHSRYNNQLTDAGNKLFDESQILPESDFAIKSTEVFVTNHGLYGKLRVNDSKVVYFDQYLTLGYGDVELSSGTTKTMSVDLGLAFWIGKHMSSRFGVKNEFYTQKKKYGTADAYNAMGYIEFGYLFGEGNRG
jgi:outer membrane beta-barrel protein